MTSDEVLTDCGVRSEDVQFFWSSGSGLIPRTLRQGITLLDTNWFKPRGYKHFDRPVNSAFTAKAMNAEFVAKHSFSPLIHYTKQTKRYKKGRHKTVNKDRPIMYASHKDACILSYYSHLLNEALRSFYEENDLDEAVIAYRALGKGNYDFSAEAYEFANSNQPVTILAFDVTGFFDNLDHGLLKERLKRILGTSSLPTDWYKVYSNLTKYHFVELEQLRECPEFAERLKSRAAKMIAPIADVKTAGVDFHSNPTPGKGIPQGTPISATLSNAYMIEFDQKAKLFCDGIGALYRRYSDDILIICDPMHSKEAQVKIMELIDQENLELSPEKTEVSDFSATPAVKIGSRAAQYLGFTLDPSGASIRPGSLSRQWRKMRKSIRRTRKVAAAAMAKGKADKVYTKRLRKRFSPLQFRNFSSYARRSAKAFGDNKQIMRQIRRFERGFEKELAKLEDDLNK